MAGALALSLLAGCGGESSYSSSNGSSTDGTSAVAAPGGQPAAPGFESPSPTVGSHDSVVATASSTAIAVVVGAAQTLSINFTSSDGELMTGFSISLALGGLPAGWSGPSTFTCAAVSTGNGCVLNLQYAPSAVGSGTLTVPYVVVDDAGLADTTGAIAIPYVATPHDNVIAAASPAGEIDAVNGSGRVSVAVDFTTDDGNAATSLNVTTDLRSLPAGWSSASPTFSCAIVSTGNGCQLALTYAAAGASGTLTLNYSYLDDSGAGKSGTLNIPFRATASNNVIAAASPSSEIIAVQKTGGQPVTVTFTTDDGKPASGLLVTSSLTDLPAGWASAAKRFSCASVSTGNGCQLALMYAPAALTSGTLILAYTYTDAGGVVKDGLLNLKYAATTNDNVVGTASPAGEINAVVGVGTQAVAVSFTTDDGRPATALDVTSGLAALPAGWTSTAGAFDCSGVNGDAACVLLLTYAPSTAGSGTLNLGYSYDNDAGQAKTGAVAIAYRATTNDNVVATPSQPSLTVRTGSTNNLTITFTTDDGNPASLLAVTSGLAALPAGWTSTASTLACATVSAGTPCTLSLSFAPTAAAAGTLTLGFGYTNDAGIPKNGTVSIPYSAITPYLYVANSGSTDLSTCPLNADNSVAACSTTAYSAAAPDGLSQNGNSIYLTSTVGNSVSQCTLAAGGTLSGCTATGGGFSAPTAVTVNAAGTFAYVDQSNGLTVCSVAAGVGSLSNCAAAAAALAPLTGIALSTDGLHLYAVHAPGVIDVCNVAANGTLSTCAATGANTALVLATLAVQGNFLYTSTTLGALNVCPINADATLGSCQSTATGSNAAALAFLGTTAFLSTQSNAVLTCPLNPDGTLGTCTAVNDPTFQGTAGVVVR
jgi:6-phosphogluconolactonase (cycloisomerase 2 family)